MDIFCQFWYIRLPSIFAVPYSQRWRSQAAPPCGQFRCLAGDGWRGTTWQQSRYGLVSFCFFRNPDSKSLYHCAPLRWYIGIQSMHFYLQYNVYLCRYIVYLFVDKKLCIYIYIYILWDFCWFWPFVYLDESNTGCPEGMKNTLEVLGSCLYNTALCR